MRGHVTTTTLYMLLIALAAQPFQPRTRLVRKRRREGSATRSAKLIELTFDECPSLMC